MQATFKESNFTFFSLPVLGSKVWRASGFRRWVQARSLMCMRNWVLYNLLITELKLPLSFLYVGHSTRAWALLVTLDFYSISGPQKYSSCLLHNYMVYTHTHIIALFGKKKSLMYKLRNVIVSSYKPMSLTLQARASKLQPWDQLWPTRCFYK